ASTPDGLRTRILRTWPRERPRSTGFIRRSTSSTAARASSIRSSTASTQARTSGASSSKTTESRTGSGFLRRVSQGHQRRRARREDGGAEEVLRPPWLLGRRYVHCQRQRAVLVAGEGHGEARAPD